MLCNRLRGTRSRKIIRARAGQLKSSCLTTFETGFSNVAFIVPLNGRQPASPQLKPYTGTANSAGGKIVVRFMSRS